MREGVFPCWLFTTLDSRTYWVARSHHCLGSPEVVVERAFEIYERGRASFHVGCLPTRF